MVDASRSIYKKGLEADDNVITMGKLLETRPD